LDSTAVVELTPTLLAGEHDASVGGLLSKTRYCPPPPPPPENAA